MNAGKRTLLASVATLTLSAGLTTASAGLSGTGSVVVWNAPGGNNHAFEVVADSSSSWTQAQAAAAASGGYLTTIRSAAQDQFIDGLLTNSNAATGSYWMGFTRMGSPAPTTSGPGATANLYHWADGEPVTYTNWGQGLPDNGMGIEDSGSILWTQDAPGSTSSSATPAAVPLPTAAWMFFPGAALALVAARRMRRPA